MMPHMYVLVINCGSSSLKASIIDHRTGAHIADARVERIGEDEPRIKLNGKWAACQAPDARAALAAALPSLTSALPSGAELEAVGHRVVHGGEAFVRPTVIDDEVETAIESLIPLAPLHNPANLAGVRAARAALPNLTHVAVFDTAFHATLPRRAKNYAIDGEVADKHGIRRYGFHGISHQFVSRAAAEYLDSDVRDLRIISCHLGNGCSVAAVEFGRCVETSMGMTPLEGLVMGTRAGDLDAGVIVQLLRSGEFDVDGIDNLLNRRSGLAGLSGVGNDMRDIEARAAEGDERCRLAMQVFAHRVRKYIGAYAAVMGGVDAICFAGGIGENSVPVRNRIAQRLDFLGAKLASDRNRDVAVGIGADAPTVAEISTQHSRSRLLVVATDEARGIARDTMRRVLELERTRGELTIPVAVSARHVHLSQDTVEALWGPGHQLTPRNPLSQPGQFACEETVTLIGPKRNIERVRVLGPARSKNQIEIARTDEFRLGLDAPVRASGDVANSPGITLETAEGTRVELSEGVICALRHIHMTPEDAERFGVKDRDIVEVAVDTNGRDLVFGDVLVRVKSSYKLEMHIDTDEGNAAGVTRDTTAALVEVGKATLRRRGTRYDNVER